MIGISIIRRGGAALLVGAALAVGALSPVARAQTAISAQSQPRLHALLIAATDYADPVWRDMPSAAADAFLLARVLLDRGANASDVRLLTEGAPSDTLWPEFQKAQAELTRNDARDLAQRGVTPLGGPTRGLILEELDRLVRVAKSGEQVFIAMSGHGEQQRTDRLQQEPDGFDETFIPIDSVLRPNGQFEGAVVDDEIGQRVEALLANGVQVVFVGDFCHSEDSTRSSGERRSAGGRSDVRLLAGAVGTTNEQGRGRFTGFYAAPSLSAALALLVPYWAEDVGTQRVHGALTFYLAVALQDPSLASMRDVQARVERDINMQARTRTNPRLPPPQFEGDFAAPLPGSGVGLAANLWQVSKALSVLTQDGRVEVAELTLPAGTLNGVEPGAVYALSQTQGGQERVILYGRTEDVTATRAVLRPVAAGDLTTAAWTDLRLEDDTVMLRPETFTARLFAPGAPETVWISRPAPLEGAPTAAQAEALADIDALYQVQARGLDATPGSTVALPPYVRLVETGAEGASLSLAFQADALVIQDEGENGRALARMDLVRALERIRPAGSTARLSSLRASLAEGLSEAARFQRMRSAASRVSDTAAEGGVSPFDGLDLSLYRYRPNGDEACAPPWGIGSHVEWSSVEGVPTGAVEIDPGLLGSPGGAQACDTFMIEIRNEGSLHVAQSALRGRFNDDWMAVCDRSSPAVQGAAGAGAPDPRLAGAVAPEDAYACTQPVSVGVVVLSSDSAIRTLVMPGATPTQRATGATQINRGGRARYVYVITNSDPDSPLRTDFMVLAARSLYQQERVPAQFSQLCQRPLQDAFFGPMGPGERGEDDPCLAIQDRFRGNRNAGTTTAPATVNGLFDLLSGEATRGDTPQPVGGTAMRRLTIQVTPRSLSQ